MPSRSLYRTLLQTAPPSTRPVNWIRSRIRRKHLISLGIPVNLDEVLPQANGKPMPAINISTRPMSAPPGARPSSGASTPVLGGRSGTPQPSSGRFIEEPQSTFAAKPKLDHNKIAEMISISPGVCNI
jgi:hypothetical protein